jgi:hypothetical protein
MKIMGGDDFFGNITPWHLSYLGSEPLPEDKGEKHEI